MLPALRFSVGTGSDTSHDRAARMSTQEARPITVKSAQIRRRGRRDVDPNGWTSRTSKIPRLIAPRRQPEASVSVFEVGPARLFFARSLVRLTSKWFPPRVVQNLFRGIAGGWAVEARRRFRFWKMKKCSAGYESPLSEAERVLVRCIVFANIEPESFRQLPYYGG
jgi:hypothetical protein